MWILSTFPSRYKPIKIDDLLSEVFKIIVSDNTYCFSDKLNSTTQ
ncbi:MAG: hypothetical protein N838_25175 [Thiohalocapsa sp. PB-PSB1]|nr:MAG: hypothetical protein N838_25175 [Thiohalocapsa sp. PB-PSB1]